MSVPVDVVLAMNIGIDEVLDISVKFMDIDIFVTGDFENEDEITVRCSRSITLFVLAYLCAQTLNRW